MATTSNLEILHLEENQDNPEVVENGDKDIIDAVTTGRLVHNMASDADYTLLTTGTVKEWHYGLLKITDTGVVLTTGRNIIVPDNKKIYHFENATAQTLTVKTAAGSGIAVTASNKAIIWSDGTNVVDLNVLLGIDDNATSTVIYIDVNGNVGLGAAVPGTALHVDNGDATVITTEYNDTSGGYGEFLFRDDTAQKWSIGNSRSTHGTLPNTFYIYQHTDASDTSVNLTRFNVNDSGNVGLGTTAQTAKLHVDQYDASGAIPVLTLDQADVSEEMIQFETTIGTGNAIEAVGAKTLTTTHFIKVTLPGGLTRYIPCGTIA